MVRTSLVEIYKIRFLKHSVCTKTRPISSQTLRRRFAVTGVRRGLISLGVSVQPGRCLKSSAKRRIYEIISQTLRLWVVVT